MNALLLLVLAFDVFLIVMVAGAAIAQAIGDRRPAVATTVRKSPKLPNDADAIRADFLLRGKLAYMAKPSSPPSSDDEGRDA